MKIPKRPPNFQKLWLEICQEPNRMIAVLTASQEGINDKKYLHWDRLRYSKPPQGLDLDEWWAALKHRRLSTAKKTPLRGMGDTHFTYGLPDLALEQIHRIVQGAGGRIDMVDPSIVDTATRDRYIVRSLMEEAITSSQLEGASTTRRVAKEMIRTQRKPRDNDERMIVNNYATIKRIRELRNEPLTGELLFELHRLITSGTLDDSSAEGRYRRENEQIGVYDMDGALLHSPPPAAELPQRMDAMLQFANGQASEDFIFPVVRAIILHFWLAYCHPFVDGNGRCARALFYWSMLRQDYWLFEFLSISSIIKKGRAKYGRAFLYTETDDNDLTYFILYHLEVISRAIRDLHSYLDRKREELRQTEGLLRASAGFNHRQLALLSHALRHPNAEYTVKSHQTSHNIVHQTARTDLYDLVRRGLLTKRKIGRRWVFAPVPDLGEELSSNR